MWHILLGHLESLYQVSQWGTKDRPWRERPNDMVVYGHETKKWLTDSVAWLHRTQDMSAWGLLLLSVSLVRRMSQAIFQSIRFSLSYIFSFHKYSHSCFDIEPKSCKIGDWPKRYDDFTVKNYHVCLESIWACLGQINSRKGSAKCYGVVKEIGKRIYIPSRIKLPF